MVETRIPMLTIRYGSYSLVVRTPLCGSGDPGSNPGRGTIFFCIECFVSSGRLVVTVPATRYGSYSLIGRTPLCGSGNPGSNPGRGTTFLPETVQAANMTAQWGISSIGRVRRSQRRGTGIETRILHFLVVHR
jgi:hypothetical protein